ncbi:vitamin B12-dependent ribonucleotide reductase [Rhizosaccharibacter radicis]|uniref:ribonucleoside-diphosphate reductase n=1 Tax=Rhizosaccharibacter radicis TaxID=2782605 RepID=A0ABT1VZA7_9PROT|nr:vitamin B12-dependent ribonucleotide reductase [Acetobacteraceae bacterium KSS12]
MSRPVPSTRSHWNGVRLRVLSAAPDPDSVPRAVTLPADWDDNAAQGLAALVPGTGAVSLPGVSAAFLDPLCALPDAPDGIGRDLSHLLLLRQAAPHEPCWRGEEPVPSGFVLNLAAFVKPGSGLETERLAVALTLLARTLRLASRLHRPVAGRPRLLLSNLDACLAALGLDYDSDGGRDVARCLVLAAGALLNGGRNGNPLFAARCVVPGLSALAGRDRLATPPAPPIEIGWSEPGPVDAVLGVEGCGLAPIFSPLRPDGRLAGSTLARLAGRGLSPEAALALSLSGEGVLPRPGYEAWLAMHRALDGLADRMPPLPEAPRALPAGTPRRELPARRRGFTQKAAVGGHRLFLRTSEYEDGTLGEISITPPRETPALRGLMDAFARAVSLGLQHGVPLDSYVEAFAYSRFGPAGTVDGDGAIAHATSLLDYAFRMLSEAYLGRPLPDAPHADRTAPDDDLPMLPLDLPTGEAARGAGHKRGLRLVGGRG